MTGAKLCTHLNDITFRMSLSSLACNSMSEWPTASEWLTASVHVRLRESRSFWTVFIHVIPGRPRGLSLIRICLASTLSHLGYVPKQGQPHCLNDCSECKLTGSALYFNTGDEMMCQELCFWCKSLSIQLVDIFWNMDLGVYNKQ